MASDSPMFPLPLAVSGVTIAVALGLYALNRQKGDPNGPLSPKQIKIIQTTWAVVEKLGAETVGVLLFKHIFEAAPEAASLFKKLNVDLKRDLSENPALVAHAVGVVSTVGIAISMLNDLPALVPVLKDLGRRHCTYSVKKEHYPIVGAAFLKTLRLGLGDNYTNEVATAYTAMWGVVEATMLAGYPGK